MYIYTIVHLQVFQTIKQQCFLKLWRTDPQYPLIAVKCDKIGAVFQIRPQKPKTYVTAGVARKDPLLLIASNVNHSL